MILFLVSLTQFSLIVKLLALDSSIISCRACTGLFSKWFSSFLYSVMTSFILLLLRSLLSLSLGLRFLNPFLLIAWSVFPLARHNLSLRSSILYLFFQNEAFTVLSVVPGTGLKQIPSMPGVIDPGFLLSFSMAMILHSRHFSLSPAWDFRSEKAERLMLLKFIFGFNSVLSVAVAFLSSLWYSVNIFLKSKFCVGHIPSFRRVLAIFRSLTLVSLGVGDSGPRTPAATSACARPERSLFLPCPKHVKLALHVTLSSFPN